MTSHRTLAQETRLLNKVPEVTLYFWIVKVLCTTVGESAADFLNVNLNFGLTGVSVLTGALLVVALVLQFRAKRYVPATYWLTVALVSVFGTLVTDNLTDSLGVPLETSTLVFAVLLAITFVAWYSSEATLSIHSIVTRRREAFYWLAVLFTFALGTATGDLMAEVLGLGYLVTGGIVAGLIAVLALAWRFGMHPVPAFWFIYILTRPLGASIGDYLAQSPGQGGLGLGTTVTSLIFVAGILAVVTYLSVTKTDVIPADSPEPGRGGLWQTAVVLVLVLVAAGTGYSLRKSALQSDSATPVAAPPGAAPAAAGKVSPLGDLSEFRTITQDTLGKLNAGDQSGATSRVDDLETGWDNAEARLKPKDEAAWSTVDGKIDTVLRRLRATSPDPKQEKPALTDLLTALG
ncbi:hypothetical protein [Amycolatopsis saalfeldensis]|uniref:Uncharacterized membrane-anchored protein n=1 Tax=Amycolatopsis saalfeldensis TaxID=394193 RepID=A0A1H8SBI6_9PSEU|nr:hypothetical protein [Amycolatopsis saalfeldensis]SEO75714.1 Uncharacterized membrane-anchored protein [Amycolatopsis saalfeldensis]